jgi:hypothetical protein
MLRLHCSEKGIWEQVNPDLPDVASINATEPEYPDFPKHPGDPPTPLSEEDDNAYNQSKIKYDALKLNYDIESKHHTEKVNRYKVLAA